MVEGAGKNEDGTLFGAVIIAALWHFVTARSLAPNEVGKARLAQPL